MEKKIAKKAPGLSIGVEGMKGPIAEDELSKCGDFGSNISKLVLI